MERRSEGTSARAGRVAGVWLLAAALAILMTWPLARGLGYLGRTQNSGDARFAVWNVAWVAHALTTDPGRLFDANIFHPHDNALAFSEANLGAGVLALPAWLFTRNPFAAFNVVVLFAFASSVVAMFHLVRHLTNDRRAAWVAGFLYAFCPYLFAHTAHIQLLLAAGIPLSMLSMHRLVDAPSAARGAVLGVALAAQALSCGYYGIFAGLLVGFATFFYAWSRRCFLSGRYWAAIAIGAAVSIGIVAPFFLPYLEIQQETGFARTLDDARMFAANWRSYLASSAHLHKWMLPALERMGGWGGEVLFPGFAAILYAAVGITAVAARSGAEPSATRLSRDRETVLLYALFAVLAFWTSLGPDGGLYTLLYEAIPVFSFLRAPGRTGLVVMLALAVLAAFGVRAVLRRFSERGQLAVVGVICALAFVDLVQLPFDWRPAEPIPSAYRILATSPRGSVAEFPFYERRIDFHIHTRYMLNSTVHWQPLVNGYSDHIPAEFRKAALRLVSFPSRDAFDVLRQYRVRYVVVHPSRYDRASAESVSTRLEEFKQFLRPLADDGVVQIFEVTGFPQ
jgi:hypothetical protein